MTHLRIEQNNSAIEQVSSAVITKLYELAISGDLDNTSNFIGTLLTTYAYEDEVDYLESNYQDLSINVTVGKYLRILDPVVNSILSTTWGDGTGITLALAASVTNFLDKFHDNTSITSFNELYKFTNITLINANNRFNNCTNLTSIDLRNITQISGTNGYQRWNFESCSNLENIGDTSNLTYLGFMAFNSCTKLKSINTSNVTVFKASCLYNCTGLTNNIVLNQAITEIGDDAFRNVTKLPDTIYLPNLQSLGNAFMYTNIKHVTDLGIITEIGGVFTNNSPFYHCAQLLDVVIPETVTSLKHACFGECSNLRYVKVLSNTVPTYSSLDGHGTTRSFGRFFGEYYRNEDTSDTYQGHTYPIYVKDTLLSQYQSANNWMYVGPNRLRPLSQFATDFPNG